MVTEREYSFAKTILAILDNHRDWTIVDPIEVMAQRLGRDHELASRHWFSAMRAIKEYENGSN